MVCDVSGKNPNVMFELGMRLAFDKPTIIVKDDKTAYSFDTSPIEHLGYPRDLRFAQIVEFRQQLADKIQGTYNKSKSDRTYTTFLKHFGSFSVAKVETKALDASEVVLEEVRSLKALILRRGIGHMATQEPQEFALFEDRPTSHEALIDSAIRRAAAAGVLWHKASKGPRVEHLKAYIRSRYPIEEIFRSPGEFDRVLAHRLKMLTPKILR